MPVHKLSVQEYLEGEKVSPIRHEYLDGEVYAMSGTTRRHNQIAGNFYSRLLAHLRGGPCEVYISDVKVFIEAFNFYYYPDVVVTCDPEDASEYVVARPCLIVEVASPSTASTDRREKQRAYRRLGSLRDYVLIEQDEMKVTIYRRDARGTWWEEDLGPEDELNLDSVGLTLKVSDLYQGVVLP
jgi:Uma2 family endonuclease